jgi:hypothetical protein
LGKATWERLLGKGYLGKATWERLLGKGYLGKTTSFHQNGKVKNIVAALEGVLLAKHVTVVVGFNF